MILEGTVVNGQIVLNGGRQLPEGTRVEIHVDREFRKAASALGDMLLKHAGRAEGLPVDMATQHDHYLYGTGKR